MKKWLTIALSLYLQKAHAGINVYHPASFSQSTQMTCQGAFGVTSLPSIHLIPYSLPFSHGRIALREDVARSENPANRVFNLLKRVRQSFDFRAKDGENLFSGDRSEEFASEDESLPLDRTILVESFDDLTGETEGVLRCFYGGDLHRPYTIHIFDNEELPVKTPMEYHQVQGDTSFLPKHRCELGRLFVFNEKAKTRVVSDLFAAAFHSVFIPESRRLVRLKGQTSSFDYPLPSFTVHTDSTKRRRLFSMASFKEAHLGNQTKIAMDESVLLGEFPEVYNKLRLDIDIARDIYDLDFSSGELDAAIDSAKTALLKNIFSDTFSEAHRFLAELYFDKGNFSQGFHHAEKAILADPHSGPVLATYLRGFRSNSGFFMPGNRLIQESDRELWTAKVRPLLEETQILDNKFHFENMQVQLRFRVYPPAVASYENFLFELHSNDIDRISHLRKELLLRQQDSSSLVFWSVVRLASFDPKRVTLKNGRTGFKLLDEDNRLRSKIDSEPLVESDNPIRDLFYMQAIASRWPGLALYSRYFSICAQLAEMAGFKDVATHFDRIFVRFRGEETDGYLKEFESSYFRKY